MHSDPPRHAAEAVSRPPRSTERPPWSRPAWAGQPREAQGSERPAPHLLDRVPPLHRRPVSFGAEIALTRVCIGVSIVLTGLLASSLVVWLLTVPDLSAVQMVRQGVFVLAGAALLYGAFVYQVARLGHLQRARAFTPARLEDLKSLYDTTAPRLAVLIPSYCEDPRLIRLTMMSAALQDHPRHRVVLLIDDPPRPADAADAERQEATRRIAGELQQMLDEPARHFAATRRAFEERRSDAANLSVETRHAARRWDDAAGWFEHQAARLLVDDHVDAFFRREVLERPATQYRATAAHLRWRATYEPLDEAELDREHRRLEALFAVDLSSFERKRYANLSHAPNKAMNLNSYIQLLGGRFRVESGPDGAHLRQDEAQGTLAVPAADYLITLDADSLLLPGYATRLVHWLEQPENARFGIAQTPYSAFPDAPGAVERVAGATTDIMCLVHQGTSQYEAAYWVGANAVLRTAALQDIAEHHEERGYKVTKYIQDRTLVEDTDSTIDLVQHGWELANYPARLSYSATPADFGSLLIQRRRWANGGLLILPRFLQHVRGHRHGPRQVLGLLMRMNYLTSLAAVNVALLLLMGYSFEGVYAPMWLPLLALPYFGLYARDLVQTGYRITDVVRVYALTVLLIPVHLGGVVKSLQQAWTGRQTPFRRTPKVAARTPVPAFYVVATLVLLIHWMYAATDDLGHDRNARAIFTALNAGLLIYAVTRFLGWRSAAGDLWLRVTGRPVRWTTGAAASTRRATDGHGPDRRPVWTRPTAVLSRLAIVPVALVVGLTALAFLRMANVPVEGLSDVPFPRMNVLVAGTDSREGLTPQQRREMSLGNFEGSRADTLFLVSVHGDDAAILAFPRDLYVERCDGSRGRVNEALQMGPACLVETIQEFSGVPVSHYVQMDFTGLVDVVDAVGGVTMALDQPIVDDKSGANLPAGRQRLSGRQALSFVRVRNIDDDLGRIERQQEFMQALSGEFTDVSKLMNPLRLWHVVSDTAGALSVDRDTGPVDLARLGFALARSTSNGSMATSVVPTQPRDIGGEEVLVHDRAKAGAVFRSFADGSILRGDADTVRGLDETGAHPQLRPVLPPCCVRRAS